MKNFIISMIKKIVFLILIVIFCFASYNFYSDGSGHQIIRKNEIRPIDGFPIWIKFENDYTQQTSGIAFIKELNGAKQFLTVDDIGKIHEIRIKNDKIIYLKEIKLSSKVKEFLRYFPKWDFEEISYDRYNNRYYLSIEGNGENFREYVGVYEIEFKVQNDTFIQVTDISKINFKDDNIYLYTNNNIGFEGVAASKDKLFLGLEGFEFNNLFLDSTLIYIVDKSSKKIDKIVSTKKFGIYTICGLYSVNEKLLLGVDRNQGNIFSILFDDDYNVKEVKIYPMFLPIPKSEIKYVSAIESITEDNEKGIYVIDDPWTKFYIPDQNTLDKLDRESVENFKKYIPIMFKFKIK